MSIQEQAVQPIPVPSSRKILRIKDVEARIGFKRGFIYKYVKAGSFPKPVRIGSRSVGWDSNEIDRWIADHCHDEC